MRIVTTLLAAIVIPLGAQDIRLPANLDKLSAKATSSVDVTLDRGMLRMAAKFLDKDEDQGKTKRLIAGLEGVYVRSYEFAEEGAYDLADVEAVRAQLQGPTWSRIVGVRSKRKNDNVDVYFKVIGNGQQLGGIVIIATEPRELTIVNVVGTLDPDQLSDLGGQFHIPRLETRGWKKGLR